jgi:hypothetical protein
MIAEETCASHVLSSTKIMADIFEPAGFGGVLYTVRCRAIVPKCFT